MTIDYIGSQPLTPCVTDLEAKVSWYIQWIFTILILVGLIMVIYYLIKYFKSKKLLHKKPLLTF